MAASSAWRVESDIEIAMRDGVLLRADLWLPSGAGPHAAIIFRTPYDKAGFVSDFLGPQQAVEAGFAVVVQDCRGRFRSDGRWRPLMWAQEGEDSYDTVEWVAAQPWCTGAVGMAGPSYVGIVQIAGAVLKPPHLKAIAPAICSVARHEAPETGGAFWLDHLFGWTAFMTSDWAEKQRAAGARISDQSAATLAMASDNPRALMEHRPLRGSPLFDLPDFDISFAQLSERCATPDIDVSEIDIPVLSSGGWYDLYVRGTIGLFTDAPQGAERRMVIGPWVHSATPPGQAGQLEFGPHASADGAGLHLDHLAFFRRHLLGEETDIAPVRYFLMNANIWCSSARWPPEGMEVRQLFLRSGGRLLPSAPTGEEEGDHYRFEPSDPTPTVGGRTLGAFTVAAGPIDQAALAGRTDLLRYDAAPADQPVDIVGAVNATIFVKADVPSFDIVVRLVDVAPDGAALPITDGITRTRGHELREDHLPVEVSLADTAWRLLPGHRLRVQVQSGNYPHFDANPGTGNALGTDAEGCAANIVIACAPGAPSSIVFSVLNAPH